MHVLVLMPVADFLTRPHPSDDKKQKVYTGQGVPLGVVGEGGIRADTGEPRSPNDVILLWNAIEARRVPCKGERGGVSISWGLGTPRVFSEARTFFCLNVCIVS